MEFTGQAVSCFPGGHIWAAEVTKTVVGSGNRWRLKGLASETDT